MINAVEFLSGLISNAAIEAPIISSTCESKNEGTLGCPRCLSNNLLDGVSGLWCLDCERLAWLFVDDDRITRADQPPGCIWCEQAHCDEMPIRDGLARFTCRLCGMSHFATPNND